MSFSDIFGGGSDIDFSQAEDEYSKMLQNVQDYIGQMYGQGRGDILQGIQQAYGYNQPYMEAGKTSLTALMNSLGIGPQGAKGQQDVYQKFVSGPGYQYALNQGLQATRTGAAGAGLTGSGAEQKALQQTGQGMAEQGWNQYLTNYQNRLSNLAGAGQTSAMSQAQMSYGGGQSLAGLGLGYAGMDVNAQEMAAKARAEAEMAEQVQKEQAKQSMWGSIGSIIGGVGSIATGGGMGSLGALSGFGGGGAGNLMSGGIGQQVQMANPFANLFSQDGQVGSGQNMSVFERLLQQIMQSRQGQFGNYSYAQQ